MFMVDDVVRWEVVESPPPAQLGEVGASEASSGRGPPDRSKLG